MASKNRDQLAGAQAKVSARDLKQQQKFRAISRADDASTTGQLINPVGAVIANPTGAGGQAGAQGGFGYGNPSYMNPNLRPQNVAGNQVVPLPSGPSFTANTNTRVKLGNGQIVSMPANTTMNFTHPDGTQYPMLVPVQNGFAGVQTGAGGMLSGDKQGQVNSTTRAAGTPNLGQPPRPEGTYNPNNKDTAAQWRAYWNWEAANPQAAAAIALAEGRLSSAPVVMTREQIWQMKAAQRRRRAGTETPSYVSPVTSPTPYTGTGNFYSTILNTGSG